MTIIRNNVKQLECSLLAQIYDAVDKFIFILPPFNPFTRP